MRILVPPLGSLVRTVGAPRWCRDSSLTDLRSCWGDGMEVLITSTWANCSATHWLRVLAEESSLACGPGWCCLESVCVVQMLLRTETVHWRTDEDAAGVLFIRRT